MAYLIDVVNFNSDASCLSSAKWLKCLGGGRDSLFMQMLKNYVNCNRKMNLGLTGSTIKEIAFFNPEAIDYINGNQSIFQILARPFAHDSPLLRHPYGFRYNLEKGIACINKYFNNTSKFYLAPEIMHTGEQISILQKNGIKGIFVHHGRYSVEIRSRLPHLPFIIEGVMFSKLLCIPFVHLELEKQRLDILHGVLPAEDWCKAVQEKEAADVPIFVWRDGESCLLHPLALDNEKSLFEVEESACVDRRFLSEVHINNVKQAAKNQTRYFPMHSMRPWLNEMKLYWYVQRVSEIEKLIESSPEVNRLFWLLVINSDILSSVEKESPLIPVNKIVLQVDSNHPLWEGVEVLSETETIVLNRCERTGEGEDFLFYCEAVMYRKMNPKDVLAVWRNSEKAYLQKAYARLADELQ